MKKEKSLKRRPKLCLTLAAKNMIELRKEIEEFGPYADMVEWHAEVLDNIADLEKEDYVNILKDIKALAKTKQVIVKCPKDEVTESRILRWSLGIANYVEVSSTNPKLSRLCLEGKRKGTLSIISLEMDKMLTRSEISEEYLKLERTNADILKLSCLVRTEVACYDILEGAAAYAGLRLAKPIILVARGEEGQIARICAGDFGSEITYGAGNMQIEEGQIDIRLLTKYIKRYYKEED